MFRQEEFSLFRKTPPFSFLDEAVLRAVADEVLEDFHPKGSVILRQDGPSAEYVSVIKNGAVKISVRTNEGEEVLVGFRSAGDFFGLLSLVCGDVSPDMIVAVEDTTCYLIKKDVVLRLLRTNAPFSKACLRFVLSRLVTMTYKDIRDRTLMYGGGDKLLFTHVLSDIAVKDVITASEDISIRQAAGIMAERAISSLVLLDGAGMPAGLVTDRDLRNKVLAKGRDLNGRVGDIMSVTVIKSEAGDYCFEALLKMIRYNIHHLLVVRKGELAGIITDHDFMMLQGSSPLSIVREIERQTTVDGLAPVARKIDRIISILVKEGAKAGNITRIITEVNERLLRKVLEITEARFGPPSVSYCWIVFGSEGRKEQTFKTDQDNAIIYDDAGGASEQAERYFSEFSLFMREALVRCGFPACTADYMASNPEWRKPLSVWKGYFSHWINTPTPEAVLRSLIFFDFRPVHGNTLLAERLRAYTAHEARDKTVFLAHMASHVVRNSPPLGLFGAIRCRTEGPCKGKFDVKINALSPVIDVTRLAALESMVYPASTLSRLDELTDRGGSVVSGHTRDLAQVFEFLMSLRLRHQYHQIEKGLQPDNFIDPDSLSVLEKKMLKESFKLIRRIQDATGKKYREYML